MEDQKEFLDTPGLTYLWGKLKALLAAKAESGHSHNAATTSAAGFMSKDDKTKLNGIEAGANKYTHPDTHDASMISGLATVATTGSYSDLSNKPTIPAAVTVDSALSSSSTNPVQNKVINSALSGKSDSGHKHAAGDITSGTLAVARGGTGVTSNPSMLTNLGSTTAASVFAASPRPGVTGTLPIANGGTGATTVAAAQTALGIGGKRNTRLTIGTSKSGWTAKDCDYLCDGSADQTEINSAINALPSTGGEIVLLDGTYTISAPISIDKNNVILSGNGGATIIKRGFAGSSTNNAMVKVGEVYGCAIRNLSFNGVSATYTNTSNNMCIHLPGDLERDGQNAIEDNFLFNHAGYGIINGSHKTSIKGNHISGSLYGIYVEADHNIVTGNTCLENKNYGIHIVGSGNIVSGNISRLNTSPNIYLYSGSNNVVTDNNASVLSGDTGTTTAIQIGSAGTNNIVTNNMVGVGNIIDNGTQTAQSSYFVKVWENASPSSSFANQTVAMDLSAYSMIMVVAKEYAGAACESASFCRFGGNGRIEFLYNARQLRNYRWDANGAGVVFSYGCEGQNGATSSAIANNNEKAIPVAIYGIKDKEA